MQYLPPLSALIVFALSVPIPTTAMPTWTTTEFPLPLQPLLHKLISHPRPLLVPLPESDLPPSTAIKLFNPTIDQEFPAAAHDGPDPDPGSSIAVDIGPAPDQGKGIKLIPPIRFLPPPPSALDDHRVDLPSLPDLELVPPEAPNNPAIDPLTPVNQDSVPSLDPPHAPAPNAADPQPPPPATVRHGLPLAPMPAPAPASASSSSLPSMPTSSQSAPSPDLPSDPNCLHATLSTLRALRASASAASTYLIPASALQWCIFGISFWLTLCVVVGRCLANRRRVVRAGRRWVARRDGGWDLLGRRRRAGAGAGAGLGGSFGGFGGGDGFGGGGFGSGVGLEAGEGGDRGLGMGTAKRVLRAGQGVWIEAEGGSGRMQRVCLVGDVVVGDGDGGGFGFGYGAIGKDKEDGFV